MAEKWDVTNRELIVFFGSVMLALFIMAGSVKGLFDPLVAGIAVVTMVGFFAMAQWLETKGVFGNGMSLVWITFGLGVVMLMAGLIHRGIIPLVVYSSGSNYVAMEITNAMIYSILVLSIVAVVLAVYVFYIRKGKPISIGFKKTS